jgi:iron complex transport system permease protein
VAKQELAFDAGESELSAQKLTSNAAVTSGNSAVVAQNTGAAAALCTDDGKLPATLERSLGTDEGKMPATKKLTPALDAEEDKFLAEFDEEQAKADAAFGRKVPVWVVVLLIVLLLACILISFTLGRYNISLGDFINCIYLHFTSPTAIESSLVLERMDRVIFNVRLPRIIMVCLVGAALAVAGASYQGMFKNPLVSPDILGSSAGASLGACLALLFNLGNTWVQIGAFVGGILAVSMAVWLNKLVKYDAILGLVLGGMLVSTLFQSGTSMVKLLADSQDQLPAITFWLMGSFSSVNTDELAFAVPLFLIGFCILLSQSWKLNVLSFGDEEARAMGVNTRRTRVIVILGSTLLASTSVAVAGIVGYVGLVIPHLARAIVGPNYKTLLPISMFVGASYLLIIDNIARLLGSVEIPIGILTSILGVPFFIFIFRRNMRGW